MEPGSSKDEVFRNWCARFARQLVFSEPSKGWGVKRSSEGAPIGKDTVANNSGGVLLAWDLFGGVGTDSTTVVDNPDSINIAGQVFVAVEAFDSLNGVFPPSGSEPPMGTQLDQMIYDHHGWALSQIMNKLGIPH
jgi:hypothetical protein